MRHERAHEPRGPRIAIGDALMWSGSLAEAQIAFELATEHSASDQRRAELHISWASLDCDAAIHAASSRLAARCCTLRTSSLKHAPARKHSFTGNVGVRIDPGGLRARRAECHARGRQLRPERARSARFAAGRAQFLAGDLTAAKQELQLSVAAREESADYTAAAESYIQLGLIQNALGESADAELYTYGTRPHRPRRNQREPRPHARLALAASLAAGQRSPGAGPPADDRGDRAPARRHFSSALQTADYIAAREMALEARVELAALYASVAASSAPPESFTAAIDDLRSALDAALALELRPLACRARAVLGAMLCARGSAEPPGSPEAREAAVSARDGLVQARSLGLKLHAAAAQRVLAIALAQLGYWPPAAREFDSVVADLEHSGATVELIRTLIAYAEVERAHGSPPREADVRARVVRAQQLAETIGLAPERQLAQRLLSATSA